MAVLKVPSLQHLARQWRPSSKLISKNLVNLALNPPQFNYNPLFSATRDLVALKVPYDQVLNGINKIKREKVRENFIEVLPLIEKHFSDVNPSFFNFVEKRYYQVGRDLSVPFELPFIYGVGGQIYLPWLSFWRSNPLANENLSLFVTLVRDILEQDPDLEEARFDILDFSIPKKGEMRRLKVIDSNSVPLLDANSKREMLEIFAAGFLEASKELAMSKKASREKEKGKAADYDPTHPDLFR